MSEAVDVEHLRGWIGREEVSHDVVTASLVERFHATLGVPGPLPMMGDPVPRFMHFCLCQPVAPMTAIGADGHPTRGGFMPPVPLPRRMWAASEIVFSGDLHVGDIVRRRSRIEDVVVKNGRSGTLCFVHIAHHLDVGGQPRIEDRQTIVYREADAASSPAQAAEPAIPGETVVTCTADPVLLFRYSALTFNGHRIHYDEAYATGVEGYSGLVVQGPLQATLLYNLATREHGGRAPDIFNFRSVSALLHHDPVCLHATASETGVLRLWTSRLGGPVAMRAEARWT